MTVRDRDNGAKRLLEIARMRHRVRIGILAPQAGAAKKGAGSDHPTLVEVASAHEFGIGVPRRSFIGGWVDESTPDAGRRIRRVLRQIRRGEAPLKALELLGTWATNSMKYRISMRIPPPLSEARKRQKTVGGKSGNTPLIHTGQLRSSITHLVEIDSV